MNTLACAFAGHDPLRFPFGYDEDDELCKRVKATMQIQILSLYGNGVTDFYTNCEPGAPMWGAEFVLKIMKKFSNINLYCIIPYEEQAKKWSPQLRDRYYEILAKSTYNHLICTRYEQDCYLQCNRFLVNHAGFILAVYDEGLLTQAEPVAHLLTYAKKKRRGIITIHSNNAELTPIVINC